MSTEQTSSVRRTLNLTGRPYTIAVVVVLSIVALSAFTGYYGFPILGFVVRPEQVTPVLLLILVLVSADGRAGLLQVVRRRSIWVLLAFIALNLISTALFSPSLVKSASILTWFVLDTILFASLLALGPILSRFERALVWSIVPWALIGIISATLANQLKLTGFGVDFDWLYQVWVARGTSLEANIYATFIILLLLLFVWRYHQRPWVVVVVSALASFGLVASQTRTSFIALLGSLVVLILAGFLFRKSVTHVRARIISAGTAFVVVLAVFFASGAISSFLYEQAPLNNDGATVAPSDPATPSAAPGASSTPTSSSSTPIVPDIDNPDTKDKLGDLSLGGGTFVFRLQVFDLAKQEMNGVNLWIGNGTNTFGLRHEQPGTPGVAGHIIMLPIQIVYDVGLIGLALLVLFFVLLVRETPRHRRPILLAVIGAIAVTSTLTSSFWFAMIWIVLAVAAGSVRARRGEPTASSTPQVG
ncbi:O-antigen ligase [Mycetocola sp. BIGb0189]|uniref:hypothetical protein n=1 Tax=Mycetocola sp. BIGb0189 TaxID=2940604 RepID=UPI00216A5711|nr:hypothetical protein [Mycetocola sp. BIGb0189]MCS4277519.1 O-antigen ligase [Mycetocola sp. BIGb0189]